MPRGDQAWAWLGRLQRGSGVVWPALGFGQRGRYIGCVLWEQEPQTRTAAPTTPASGTDAVAQNSTLV